MEMTWLLGGGLILGVFMAVRIFVARARAKKPSLNSGAVLSPGGKPAFPAMPFPKKKFNFPFRPSSMLRKDVPGLDPKNMVLPKSNEVSLTVPSPVTVTPASVAPVAPVVPEKPAAEKGPSSADDLRRLQEELISVREKAAEQVNQALETLKALHGENDRLQADVDRLRVQAKNANDNQDALRMSQENTDLRSRLESATRGQNDAFGQIESLKSEFSSQLSRARETMAGLEKENVRLKSLINDQATQNNSGMEQEKIRGLQLEIDSLRQENMALKAAQGESAQDKDAGGLQERVKGLEKIQHDLEEKNQFLQYELTKSRAQASGFERICEGSKKRLEDMSEEARLMEKEREDLRCRVQELEKSLAALRSNIAGQGGQGTVSS